MKKLNAINRYDYDRTLISISFGYYDGKEKDIIYGSHLDIRKDYELAGYTMGFDKKSFVPFEKKKKDLTDLIIENNGK